MNKNKKILQIIKDNLSNDISIGPESLLQDIEIDSITFIKIIVALESEFEFEFDDEKLLFTEFPSIKDMIDYVIYRTDGVIG